MDNVEPSLLERMMNPQLHSATITTVDDLHFCKKFEQGNLLCV